MKTKSILLLLTLLLPLSKANACANEFFGTSKDGKLLHLGYSWEVPFHTNFNAALNVSKLKKIKAKLSAEHHYMLLSDYALCLLKLGKTQIALDIFKVLYRNYPNDFKLAANLGTAYELSGYNDSALKYIKKALVLNPNDHKGSEWIHVKILETKIALQKDKNYLKTHTVLQLTEKQKKDSTVLQHLQIQLQERVPFTPAVEHPNDIMASLFADLGDISFAIGALEYANAYYNIALNYYKGKVPDIAAKQKELKRLQKKYTSLPPPNDKEIMGATTRISFFKYTRLLNDNYDPNYSVNWAKIDTTVSALLQLVDFSQSEQQSKASSLQTSLQTKDSLVLLADSTTSISMLDRSAHEAPVLTGLQNKPTGTLSNYLYIALTAVLFSIFFLYRKRKRTKK